MNGWIFIKNWCIGNLKWKKATAPKCRKCCTTRNRKPIPNSLSLFANNYAGWLSTSSKGAPIMSHNLFQHKVLPHIEKGIPTFFLVIDNLRFDQWKAIEPIFAESFNILEEETFYSIFPTATQYCRNAIFAGLLPVEIEKQFPGKWKNDDEEGGKNLYEEEFFKAQLKRLRKEDIKFTYTKILHNTRWCSKW